MAKLKIMDKYIQEKEDDITNFATEDNGRSNMVDNVFENAALNVTPINNVELLNIPLDKIKPRKENKYLISDINALAESIDRTGLLNPVLVRREKISTDNCIFILVDGERRYNAKVMLRDKKRKIVDEKNLVQYDYIAARVITELEEVHEQDIHDSANTTSRKLTIFELLMTTNSSSIDMNDDKIREDYCKRFPNEINKYKPTKLSKYKYLKSLLNEKSQAYDFQVQTIKVYSELIDCAATELIKAIYGNQISIRNAIEISKLPKENQIMLIEKYDDKNFKTILRSMKSQLENESDSMKPKIQPTYNKALKSFTKISNEFTRIQKTVNNMDLTSLNSGQKKFIKDLETLIDRVDKVKKEIETPENNNK